MLVYQNLLTGNREWDAKVGHSTNPSAEGGDDQAVRALEATPSDKKQFAMFMNKLIKNLTSELEAKKKETKKNNEGAPKFLTLKLKDFQFLVVRDDG
ncbi:hypothetical protein CXB51_030766 [Gossypium anomalum]|uniref:Uncharacterized protein n=1 Tax=Gossypium anomalum TaxID=47600 RepID=A0A8J5YV90_9ROSI|nr:hypothetical protein CXB51_030766 [Gossypium anomalum]